MSTASWITLRTTPIHKRLIVFAWHPTCHCDTTFIRGSDDFAPQRIFLSGQRLLIHPFLYLSILPFLSALSTTLSPLPPPPPSCALCFSLPLFQQAEVSGGARRRLGGSEGGRERERKGCRSENGNDSFVGQAFCGKGRKVTEGLRAGG